MLRVSYSEHEEEEIHSGSGDVEDVMEDYIYLPEVILGIKSELQHMIKAIIDKGDAKANQKSMPIPKSNFDNITQGMISETQQSAYVGHVGGAVNITCLSPDEHYWCSSTSNFAKSVVWFDHSSCFTSLNDTTSSTIQVIYHTESDNIKKEMQLEEEFERMNFSASTLILKNLSVNDVGSYECFTFYSEDGSMKDLEVVYQTLYLYVEGDFEKLSVPVEHIYNKTIETESGEIVFILEATSDENIIIPCRPTHPDISIELYRQDPRLEESIVDSISNINSKVFSSKFYQHHITPLFYYHPRIGFVLDNATKQDKGKYHCRFTSSYKYEEIKTFMVKFTEQTSDVHSNNITRSNGKVSPNEKNNVSGAYSTTCTKLNHFQILCFIYLFVFNVVQH